MGEFDHSSLTMPLVFTEKQHEEKCKLQEVDASNSDADSQTAKTSFSETCLNGLNALSGVGMLSVPYALSSGGWLSLILLFVISIGAFYSGLLIQRCMDKDPSIRTYPDIGEHAFGKKGKVILSIFMNVELYLVTTAFLILEGDNLHNLFPNIEWQVSGLTIGGKKCFTVIAGLIVLPTVWFDSLSLLSYVSASGVFASGIILVSILWTGVFDGMEFHQEGSVLLDWSGIPTAVSLFAFCYCTHPVFPTLYTSMKNKRQFPNVLLLCFILCTIGYASMAVIGYLMFGSKVQSQITLNLPTEKLSSKIAIWTTLVNPLSKYALMLTPITNSAKNWCPGHRSKRAFGLLISTSLVISSVVVALLVPFFAYLMSLVGAFLSISASLIIPCLCYLKISGTYRSFGFEMFVVGLIILIGAVVVVFGTYTSLAEIIRHL